MTEPDILDAISIAIPANRANAEKIARSYLKKSILKLGRMSGVSWNRKVITFTLISGQQEYKAGVDSIPDLRGMGTIFRTDTPSNPIPIVDVQEFSRSARGSSTSGTPILATLHSDSTTFEIYPIPAGNYPMWGYIKKKIVNLSDIPEEYHDILIDYAIASIGASEDKRVAVAFAKAGLDDMRDEALTIWEENVVPIGRHLGGSVGVSGIIGSGNLRGN